MAGRRQHGEGSVYHREDRDQWVAVEDLGWKPGKDGKLARDRREFTARDLQTALDKRDEFRAQRRDGFTLPKGRQPYVGEWVLHWLYNIARPKIDPNTFYRSYRQKVEDYVVPFFARVKLNELAVEDVEAWHVWLAARPASRGGGTLSPGTVITAHRIFSASLNVAVARRRIPNNPATFAPPPDPGRPEPEPPTAEEVGLILDACQDWPNGARWVLAITTGLRQGEALGLRWRDVRLTPPASVSVRQARARIDGQDVIKAPKSAKSKRSVPLPARAVEALKAHRDGQLVRDLGGLVFTTAGGTPVASRADWADWGALLASAGVAYCRPHLARHGYATALIEEGADPRLVQDLMGHSDTRLQQIYVHVRPVMHEQARSALDRRFGG